MVLVINAIFDVLGWAWRTVRRAVTGLVRIALPGQSSGVRVLVTWALLILIVLWGWTRLKHGLAPR